MDLDFDLVLDSRLKRTWSICLDLDKDKDNSSDNDR